MKNLKLKMVSGEIVKLNNVSCLSFGVLSDERWSALPELAIFSDCGNLRFDLSQISSIEFLIEQEKRDISVSSVCIDKVID